jgi:hypothetical protein
MRNRIVLRTSAALVVTACLVLPSCSAKKATAKGELMVSVQTDMSIPKDVDRVRIEISSYGNLLFGNDYDVGASGLRIPATIGIVEGSNPGAPVLIRVIARQSNKLRVLREVTTTVPSKRSALLRMPIQWLCDGQATEPTPGQVLSTCPQGQTCIAGRCEQSKVDAETLPPYTPDQVFGGGNGSGNGECFDTVKCFSTGYEAKVNVTNCTIEKPAGGTGTSVAMVRLPKTEGICGPEACLVPIDRDPDFGWKEDGERIVLPAAVCERLLAGTVVAVSVTTSCSTKTAAMPTCGPWSSVSDTPGDFDAGAPDVPALFDAAEEEAEQPEAEAEAPDVQEEAAPEAEAGPNTCTSFNIDMSACDPVKQTGCPVEQACAVVSETVVCVQMSTNPTNHQDWPCDSSADCADGLYCPGVGSTCATYCCDAADCIPVGTGLSCNILTFTSPDGGTAQFGVCQ